MFHVGGAGLWLFMLPHSLRFDARHEAIWTIAKKRETKLKFDSISADNVQDTTPRFLTEEKMHKGVIQIETPKVLDVRPPASPLPSLLFCGSSHDFDILGVELTFQSKVFWTPGPPCAPCYSNSKRKKEGVPPLLCAVLPSFLILVTQLCLDFLVEAKFAASRRKQLDTPC